MTDGIILVDKPPDWTSFDVVAKIRNLSRVEKVGHSGTLDPMATGVLPIFLGKATKAVQYFLEGEKGYEGEMVLGIRTDTGDATGKALTPDPSPHTGRTTSGRGGKVSRERVRAVFEKFTGEIEQVPPMYSAVKVNGKRLYKLARKGIEVKREPRKVTIYDLRVTHYDSHIATDNRVSFYVLCSKGTYVRQLVVDIGEELGCGAYLSKLRRVYSHPFHISQALEMETIVTLAGIGKLNSVIIPVNSILASSPQ